MKSQHTPGQWIAVCAWIEHEDDTVADIANCDPASMDQGHLHRSYDEICSNARLLAAAPDLLEACTRMVAWAEPWKQGKPHPHDDWEFACAAIAKATGAA